MANNAARILPSEKLHSEHEATDEQLTMDQNSAFLESIILHIPNMIFVKEAKELRFVRFNKAGEELLGLSNQELIGKNDFDLFPPDQAAFFTKKDREVLARKDKCVIEEEPINTPQGKRYLYTKKIPIFNNKGEAVYLLGISEDITERKQARDLIASQQAALVSAAKMASLGEMAASIAHEINNPLSIISGLAHKLKILARNDKITPDSVTEVAARIEATVTRMSRIVKGMRSFSRDSSLDEMTVTSTEDIIQETLGLCSEKFKTNGVTLNVREIPSGMTIKCRPVQISEVILNLLNNSLDAIRELTDKWVEIKVEVEGKFMKIIITDSGPGIPVDIQDKILLPFFTTKEVGKGTGLGLSISKGIMEAHGGNLYLDTASYNTSFVMSLPI